MFTAFLQSFNPAIVVLTSATDGFTESDADSLRAVFDFCMWFFKLSVTICGISVSIWAIFCSFFVAYLICNSFKSLK